ncbi:USP domain-containing protein [Trichostrongylus colubriformis]|uniref:ubiquitinyl hydrolase 1 n=1 Tax=Trichostrongylus colubriformis TaxID=6319 RepID=A0AAN8GCT4_TRICO
MNQSSKPTGVPGLRNLGNTCYANALLQGLSSLPSMVRWLNEIDTTMSDLRYGFLYELKDVVMKLNDPSTILYDVSGVMSTLAKHNCGPEYYSWYAVLSGFINFVKCRRGVEHDLHELLNVFATTWEEELQEVKKRLLSSSLLQFNEDDLSHESGPRISAGAESGDMPSSPVSRRELVFQRCADVVRVEAKLRAPCFGLTATELRCCQSSCGFKKLRYDTFGVISLTIPKMFMGLSVTIEALLRKYFCMEVIRGATCDRCKSCTGKRDSGLFKKQGFSKVSIHINQFV